MASLLEMKGITKRFPGVLALDAVDFEVEEGEVHVLLGENGAGKSTLIKLLAGADRPDEGVIRLNGQPVEITSAADAQKLGISTIHQEFNLVPQLSVAENIFLGRPPRRLGIVDRSKMEQDASNLLSRLGLGVRPGASVSSLNVARRQLVEIAKALSSRAKMVIMDEPTAALSQTEAQRLFEIIASLKREGTSIVFISHDLDEVREVGDRITVLRDGRVAGEGTAQSSKDELIRLMVGRSIESQYPREPQKPGKELLRVRSLSRKGVLHDISLVVRGGEVVGVAGLIGAGRTELVRALFGADPSDSGDVSIEGQDLRRGNLGDARRLGLGLVPEDRQAQGLVPPLSVRDNLVLATLGTESRLGFIDRGKQSTDAGRMVDQLGIQSAGLDQEVRYLSGGNQQKVIIGRWLLAETRILLLDEPTRGVDVGAKVEIYQLMNQLTEQGAGILMISSDLQEVLGMSDRILVMAEGRLAGELASEEATQEKIMQLATRPEAHLGQE